MNRGSTLADTDVILGLLRRVERRIRAHRLAHELTFALSVVLIIPLVLKIWDFFRPLPMRTVTTVIGTCAGLFTAYAIWRLVSRHSLERAAVTLDSRANLYDQMTTAFWFITNRMSSEWIDAQIHSAAQRSANINLRALFPGVIPRTSYVAAMMILLFVGLNFVPLSLNHNWLKLQAAHAGVPPEPNKLLETIRERLEQITRDLQKSDKITETAAALFEKELQKAADELRQLARQMANARRESEQSTEKSRQSRQQASTNTTPGLEDLLKNLTRASEGVKSRDPQAAKEGVKQATNNLESLNEGMRKQESKDQKGQPREAAEESNQHGSPDGERQPDPKIGERGKSSKEKSDRENAGRGDDPNGKAPGDGAPTSLEVQLERERVAAMPLGGSIPENVEETSKQQLSKLEYQNVKAELSAAQKDLLNQDGVPWEYRRLIKKYFEAIRPR